MEDRIADRIAELERWRHDVVDPQLAEGREARQLLPFVRHMQEAMELRRLFRQRAVRVMAALVSLSAIGAFLLQVVRVL